LRSKIKRYALTTIVVALSISAGATINNNIVMAGTTPCADGPDVIGDKNLRLLPVFKGLRTPISMAFLGPGDILVALKDGGTVHRIINGNILPDPLLNLEVANALERGLLGLAVSKNESGGATNVFVFYTKSGGGKDGDDIRFDGKNITRGINPFGSVLERYDLIDNKLVNPKLLLYINSTPNPIPDNPRDEMHHVGGKLLVGPDENLYVITGDSVNQKTQSQNYANGPAPNGTSGVIRVTQDGRPVSTGPLGTEPPWIYYFGYGIRNGFGMDFDPVTGSLWDTEPGQIYDDEINIVKPGFNGGWGAIQGFAKDSPGKSTSDLFYPNGSGMYRDPVFNWHYRVTPTAIKFFNSDNLGKTYENDLFVSRYNGGIANQSYLYHFDLTSNRSELLINDASLEDKVVNNADEDRKLAFAECLGIITDMQVGPDGYLYILEHMSGQEGSVGTIYRLERIW
jgi:glucose/arabinose dehydrogenase